MTIRTKTFNKGVFVTGAVPTQTNFGDVFDSYTDMFIMSGAPTVSNDNTQGYVAGSHWYDSTNDVLYMASSVATGAAVWVQIIRANLGLTKTSTSMNFNPSSATNTTIFGTSAGNATISGGGNVVFGPSAGSALAAGGNNCIFGSAAGASISGNSQSSFFGQAAGNRTTGGTNSFFGFQAGNAVTSAVQNTVVGASAANNSSAAMGQDNVVIGYSAAPGSGLTSSTKQNVIIGSTSATALTTASNTVLIGYNSGVAVTSSANNVVVGANAATNMTSAGNTVIGTSAGISIGSNANNTAVGFNAMNGGTIGSQNVAIGTSALLSASITTSASDNVVIGYSTGTANTSGNSNTIIGSQSSQRLTSAGTNVIIGYSSGGTITTSNNSTVVGANAARDDANTGVLGSTNTLVGYNILRNAASMTSTTASNVLVGASIGSTAWTTGNNNVIIGTSAGGSVTTGSNNIFLGSSAGDSTAATASNRFVAGSGTAAITTAFFGAGETGTSPAATGCTITTTSTATGTSNVAGSAIVVAGGKSTGNALGGAVIFQTAPAGGAGSTQNALAEVARFTSTANLLVGTNSDGGTKIVVDGAGTNAALPSTITSGTGIRLAMADSQTPYIEGISFGTDALFLNGVAAGGTRSSPSATPADTFLVGYQAFGYTSASPNASAAGIVAIQADGLWSVSNKGVYHTWRGVPNGSTTRAEWMRLQGANLLIGGTTNITGTGGLKVFGTTASSSSTTGAFQVSGGVGIAGDLYGGGQIIATDGTNSLRMLVSGTNGVFGTTTSKPIVIQTNGGQVATFTAAGSFVLGTAALATNATDGFLYIPTCAGAPTGTPTANTGRVAMIYDSTNNNFYIYNGAWKKTTTFT